MFRDVKLSWNSSGVHKPQNNCDEFATMCRLQISIGLYNVATAHGKTKDISNSEWLDHE